MLSLKIRFIAKTECKNHGAKNIIWLELPFIQKLTEECTILQEKILSREKKANQIFQRIASIQSEYTSILHERNEKIIEINNKIQDKKDKINDIDNQIKIIHGQIQDFNAGQPLAAPITKLRKEDERLAKEKMLLQADVDELIRQIDTKRNETKTLLKSKFQELKKEYKNFSERIRIINNKISQQVTERKTQASSYADFFWKCYDKKYNKQRRNNSASPSKPPLYIDQLFIVNEIFTKEKKSIDEFNQKHNIDYTLS